MGTAPHLSLCLGGIQKNRAQRSAILVLMRRWIVTSFLVGFVLVGGALAWLAYAEDTDIHQQSYAPDRVSSDVLKMLAMFGLPSGLLSIAITAGVRKSIKAGWWETSKPKP
ncbi:MAG TPA: hypothetical protein EYN91_16790 [Candidatus Melainabacteria bacterium]|jgi:hypothetical protein|nr:hypothetical protein [Candidatus Melainabacteria bacterium]HIN63800.1 hypothetical protein [Candidatus Obscuribacterales bacterium]